MLHSFISNKNKQNQQQRQDSSNSNKNTSVDLNNNSSNIIKKPSPSSSTSPDSSSSLSTQIAKASSASLSSSSSSASSSSLPIINQRQLRYSTMIAYDAAMLAHECTCKNSRMHLETPDRIESIYARICATGLDAECEMLAGDSASNRYMASINDLLNCHNEQYALIFGSDIEQRAKLPKEYLQQYLMKICMAPCGGLALEQDQDNAWNEESTPVACRVAVGSVYEMARLVWESKIPNGFGLVRPPGSHAEYNRPLYVYFC